MQRPTLLVSYTWAHACCSVNLLFLSLLAFQNAAAVLLTSYTQQRHLAAGAERFTVTHVVLMQEVTKLIASLVWCAVDVYRFVGAHEVDMNAEEAVVKVPDETWQQPTRVVIGKAAPVPTFSSPSEDLHHKDEVADVSDKVYLTRAEKWNVCKRRFFLELFHQSALWMLLPAALYSLQNCCIYLALANIEPTLFQVTYQSRIFITLLFMVCFMKRTFLLRQWLALVLLVFGVTAAQLGSRVSLVSNQSTVGMFKGDCVTGVVATVASSTLSSAASVLMEAFLKSTSISMRSFTSTKNVHLSFYSALYIALLQLLGDGGKAFTELSRTGLTDSVGAYFCGFDYLVWMLVLVQSIGGLLVAVVLRYSDNIMRTFASGVSLMLSGFCSSYLYSFMPSTLFLIGNVASIGAITLYNC
ncbi:CMP-sialic acid transporter [Trypanosoma rangeli]|uniref:CMP-sialic acid transporter n=1 Tax=Trypanosoma rangeli TaxID=5698 RepID=A0A422P321_TRYRA|nr:CMP-sialic acid transporter [Trypanosoma rangeli]RNF12099.1 CMP-sialic acid transporter [Trypanosoma rangeli]|eukprot:RNF12099.1 CMP-sialic acid transporter [Trypanosoma rangeli]